MTYLLSHTIDPDSMKYINSIPKEKNFFDGYERGL